MGRKGRKGRSNLAMAEPVAVETEDDVCAGGCCGGERGVKSDGDETVPSCSSGEEDSATQGGDTSCCSQGKKAEAGDCAATEASKGEVGGSSCCSSKSPETEKIPGGCCGGDETPMEAVSDDCCAGEDACLDDCCAEEETPQTTSCCSSKEDPKTGGDSCCAGDKDPTEILDNCCASEKEPKTSGCCSSETKTSAGSGCCSLDAPKASNDCSSKTLKEEDKVKSCCASKKQPKACSSNPSKASRGSNCCSSKTPTASAGGCCRSPRPKRKLSGSGCCSKPQPPPFPERTPSFLKRLMQFRSDRGATLDKQRTASSSSGQKGEVSGSLETLRLNISGMTCSGCCTRIEKYLGAQLGVVNVNVSLLTCRGIFQFDPQLVTAKRIEQTVATLGFEPSVLSSEELVSVVLHLSQPESVTRAKEGLRQCAGVASAEDVDEPAASSGSPSKALLVEYDPDITGARTIVRHLSRELGFSVQASTPRAPSVRAGEGEVRRFTRLLLWSCLLSLPVVFVEFVLPVLFSSVNNPANAAVWGTANHLSIKDAVEFVCATPVLFAVARPIHESAYLALRYGGRVTMDVLISLSACTAYVFSVFTVITEALTESKTPGVVATQVDPVIGLASPPPHEQEEAPIRADTFFQVTVLLITLILFGRYIETLAKARASNSVDALLRMQAKTAILLEEDGQKELYIDVVLVERGDLLKVLPGTRVPTDGVVVGGASSVDESMVTGEARKVPKESGATVIGGSINAQGVLTMRVTHTLHESMLARMVRLVGEAQASRGVRQSIADVVAAYFTTFIIIVACSMFMLWYWLAINGHVDTQGWAPFPFALRFAITVLVISCPCAISLAVPTAVMVSTTKGSQVGILFKGGRALEALEDVDVVVFDKTGTLTTAQLGVANVFTPSDGINRAQLWRYVASAERDSEHSIGKALVAHAEAQMHDYSVEEAKDFEAVPGCGVRCTVGGVDVRIGSLTWLTQRTEGDCGVLKIPSEFVDTNQRFQAQGCIVVFVVVNGVLLSSIALRDSPRPEAKRVIEQLKREGIQPWIVTGDQRGTALNVAASLGVPDGSVLAETLPHQKVDKVRLLQSLGRRVAFVGDGVNDAPALATADVGVAVGAGTDVALDAADVVLVKDDLRDLLNARALSNVTNRRIKHNFAWGFMYNLLMMPVACGVLYAPFGIWIPPALAGLSELLSSVPVILFSLLLSFWKPPYGGILGVLEECGFGVRSRNVDIHRQCLIATIIS
ncbi:hypothetical protein JM16_001469 [Phytophthora kernoviae]|uniref:P-type Cu(+) transporter n=1 Tax=Phytophthora kernoviae TaxID=325452 RepID=A0A8T0M7E5_9STRA|nr:hypothetical protein JM16_001469 [Phytophthora kernoviae]